MEFPDPDGSLAVPKGRLDIGVWGQWKVSLSKVLPTTTIYNSKDVDPLSPSPAVPKTCLNPAIDSDSPLSLQR